MLRCSIDYGCELLNMAYHTYSFTTQREYKGYIIYVFERYLHESGNKEFVGTGVTVGDPDQQDMITETERRPQQPVIERLIDDAKSYIDGVELPESETGSSHTPSSSGLIDNGSGMGKSNIEQLLEPLKQKDLPLFDQVRNVSENILDDPQVTLHIVVSDPYSPRQTTEKEINLTVVTDTRIIGDQGRSRLFVLPGGIVGHFDMHEGTDRMPNIVVEFAVIVDKRDNHKK